MSYSDLVAADIRLAILTILARANDYTANAYALQTGLATDYGHALSLDRLRTELAWLDEQRLLTVQRPGGIDLATLNSRGYDVRRGVSSVPGIARPRPEL